MTTKQKAISAKEVSELRQRTGAGMMDCKKALEETGGDMEAAVDWLRTRGLAKAAKKAGRIAAEGLVGVSLDGTKGAIVEVNSETDFVARNEQFQALVRSIAEVALAAGSELEALRRAENAYSVGAASASPASVPGSAPGPAFMRAAIASGFARRRRGRRRRLRSVSSAAGSAPRSEL